MMIPNSPLTPQALHGAASIPNNDVDRAVSIAERSQYDDAQWDQSETLSRVLVRIVPLAYGLLLGGLADKLVTGFVAGTVLAAGFDLYMGHKSLLRAIARRLAGVVKGG